MQPHIQKAYDFINEYLPADYTLETQKLLQKHQINVSKSVIRNVRIQKTTSNIDVINALLKVARKHKKKLEATILETQNH